jgi:hypothetical protein
MSDVTRWLSLAQHGATVQERAFFADKAKKALAAAVDARLTPTQKIMRHAEAVAARKKGK